MCPRQRWDSFFECHDEVSAHSLFPNKGLQEHLEVENEKEEY